MLQKAGHLAQGFMNIWKEDAHAGKDTFTYRIRLIQSDN